MTETQNPLDVLIVGAGFAGVYGVHKFRSMGFNVLAVEAGENVGGTWYWNRYPGLRCDVDSLEYCFGFSEELQRDWTWTERYARQEEIERYINYAADRLDVRKDIRFNARVASTAFDEASALWTVTLENGDSYQSRFIVMATGCLTVPKTPDIAGIGDFKGELFHSVRWPRQSPDLSGKNVAVIGTGSTGVQMIPLLAQQAKNLVVVQRTPAYCVPARNGPWPQERVEYWRENFTQLRDMAKNSRAGVLHEYGILPLHAIRAEDREADLERRWLKGGPNVTYAFNDVVTNKAANEVVAEFFHRKIRSAVTDPATAEKLIPSGFPIATKRMCVGTDYYETYNRDNVQLIDLRTEKLEQIEAHGIRTTDGFYPVDVIILATGYDAMTGALLAIDIQGRDGHRLREDWSHGPESYIGMGISGYPNMFVVTGPGSPSVFSNVVVSIEHDIEWIADCLAYMREHGKQTIEADPAAQDRWMDHVDEVAGRTLLNEAASWYRGANVAGKPQRFMPYVGGVNTYRDTCRQIAANGYEGFNIDGGSDARGEPAIAQTADT
ncbi:flavin-containing monooxygenase [Novosphingobium colocasiae]|uniref:Cyclohexanone monooxygenase n=1 Tax=Novosphingobium colocasiae TaxID=1256513 RepID=A0A918PCN9_9SPHN|nr:NAD(P)/FAD-dependent oxidoreductase [Novosphingobium colocasiae]GGY98158.1 cyclohexanone monooxygenase [Novosphingobium colocasiae]